MKDFNLFSSLRYDPLLATSGENGRLSSPAGDTSGRLCPFYMLRYHRDRLLFAAEHFGWAQTVARLSGDAGLAQLEADLEREVQSFNNGQDALKIRTLLSSRADLKVEMSPVPSVSLQALLPDSLPPPTLEKGDVNICLDPQTTPVSPFTCFKTTERDMYTSSRERVGITSLTNPTEVILFNDRDEAMEGSLTSVFFWVQPGKWVTPLAGTTGAGGQLGTTRRWLLEKNMCEEGIVERDQIHEGQFVYVSNGVKGLVKGRVVLGRSS